MGIPTPTYYDQLLLTKCKLLLQAALSNPKRRGGAISFEEFVTGLDAQDESTIRMFEMLLQETAIRRPRKTAVATSGNDDPAASASQRRRPHASLASAVRGQLPPDIVTRRRLLISDSDDDSDDDTSEDLDLGMRILDRPPEIVSEGEDELAMSILDPQASSAARERFIAARLPPASNALGATAVGIPIDRVVTTTTTSSGEGGGRVTANAQTPSDRLREMERGSLFGFDEPAPSFSDLLSHIADDLVPSNAIAGPSSSSSAYPELPTYQELWSVVTDGEEPFPSESVTSFDSFLNRLNSTAAVANLSSSSPTLNATDMMGLLDELTLRDVSIPIRVRNTIARRRSNRSSNGGSRRRPTNGRDGRVTANHDVSPLFEGMWRVPTAQGDSATGEGETGAGASRIAGSTFSEFARRRRALTREREEAGAVAIADAAGGGGSSAMTVDSSTTSSTAQQTPQVSTPATALSSPATSHAASPVASACPAPVELPPRPLTSADRAIAAMRQQREIAPLPTLTTATSTTDANARDPMLGLADDAPDAGRIAPIDSTLNTRVNLRSWVDRMIARGLDMGTNGDWAAVEGEDPNSPSVLERQRQVRELFARPPSSSSSHLRP
ncbi:hypothetical protein JCM11491_000838 [Sporobolomyces phaffii]